MMNYNMSGSVLDSKAIYKWVRQILPVRKSEYRMINATSTHTYDSYCGILVKGWLISWAGKERWINEMTLKPNSWKTKNLTGGEWKRIKVCSHGAVKDTVILCGTCQY